MARIEGLAKSKAGLLARIVYFVTRCKLGRVIEPIKVFAHHPRLMRGLVHIELAQEASTTVDGRLKALAQVRVATLVGCPF